MLEKGDRLSRYEILDRIGRGGMGVVYRAFDTRLRRTVVIKVLPAEAMDVADRRRRFVQEATAASALNHSNIVTIYDIDQSVLSGRRFDFIVMEEISGQPLSERLRKGPLEPEQALHFAHQIAEALGAVHAAGIVHRDIKPANLMVTSAGTLKVLDFGLAKVGLAGPLDSHAPTRIEAELTVSGAFVGTPGYMAPEQILGNTPDARCDVFSTGVVLYEMLCGRRPFSRTTDVETLSAILHEDPPPLDEVRPGLPVSVKELVGRSLAKDPDQRPQSGRELASALRECLSELQPQRAASPTTWARRLRSFVLAAVFLLSLSAAGAWLIRHNAALTRARSRTMPEIEHALEQEDYDAAFRLVRSVVPLLENDPQFQRLSHEASSTISLVTEPAEAQAWVRGYQALDRDWIPIGSTPLDSVAIPGGLLRMRATAPNCTPLEVAISGWEDSNVHLRLNRLGKDPEGMVRVTGGEMEGGGRPTTTIDDFWLDRCEVANREYKAFVDAGGYRRAEFWPPFVLEGQSVSFEKGIARLADATGRPGPATWELGSYRDGEEDLPVSGVSWYEASAYARWSGKVLPTVFYWRYAAAGAGLFSDILHFSNFSNRSLVPVGTMAGLAPSGALDMAGNVKEWCSTAYGAQRFLQGGSFDESPYLFLVDEGADPWERAAHDGFRCARYDRESVGIADPAPTSFRRADLEKPLGDEAFQAIMSVYDFDPLPLDGRVESVDEKISFWRHERVSFRAAYGDERVAAHLYLPRNVSPPYQALLYWPPADAYFLSSSENMPTMEFDFLVRSGRAVLFPIYKGTYERRGTIAEGPNVNRDRLVMGMKDLKRAVDYLSTRDDIDMNKLAYFGVSSGANRAPLALVLEPRLRTAVMVSGGLWSQPRPPEIESLHFAPRVKQPVLMINGRYDFDEPYESLQLPMFRLLGTPAADKRHVLVDSGHVPPRNEVIRESLAWFDRYLGPVMMMQPSEEE